MLAARWKREISLEYLTEEKFVPLSTTDEYFQVPDYGETYPFSVRGQTILLDSCSLAAALAGLPEQTQEVNFVISSVAVLDCAWNSQHLSTWEWRLSFSVCAFLISISTVFLKQHSVLDILGAIQICVLAWWAVYGKYCFWNRG